MTLSVALKHAFAGFTLNVAFEAEQGVTALFGHSGAGKTTVINAVAGLLRPNQGRIAVDGVALVDTAAGDWKPPHRRRVGYVFQEARLFPHLSVRQNLQYGARFAGTLGDTATFDRVTGLLGIAPLLDRRPSGLSGGERQRVAIGRALLSNPLILLMDEPLAALDDARKTEILPYLERLRDDTSIPILYVSHTVSEIARLATTVVCMEAGRVIRTQRSDEFLSDLGAMPAAGGPAPGSILSGRVVRHHDDGLTEVSVSNGVLFLPLLDAATDAILRVHITEQDVILSRERPAGLSELNILPARVTGLHQGDGPGVTVRLSCGDADLSARVTRRSARELGLEPGTDCFAILKSATVTLADRAPAAAPR